MSLLPESRADELANREPIEAAAELPPSAPRSAPADIPTPVEEHLEVPPAPKVFGAVRAATSGFYFNSLLLIAANVVWGALLLLIAALVFSVLSVALLVFVLILPIPTAVIFRMAALIQRGQPISLSDALAWRTVARRGIGVGLIVGSGSLVLIYNVIVGFSSYSTFGWAFGTSAAWGLIVVWFLAGALWPLLFDPLRQEESVTALLKLAATVILVKPGRFLLLMLLVGGILFVSAVLAVALVTISMAFAALVLAAYVIPAADRIEQRRTFVVIS